MQQIINNSSVCGYDKATIFYNMVGNFIPPEWRGLSHPSGKVLSKTSRQLLSLIVSCLESSSGTNHAASELQESYYFFEQRLGVCQRRVRQCFVELQQAGFLTLELLSVIKNHIKCRNILSIKLLKDFKNIQAVGGHSNVKKFPADMKELSAQAEKSFRLERKNFQPHNIIDNNISILKSRSSEKSSFVNFCEENSIDKERVQKSEHHDDDQDPPQGNSSNWLAKVATKAKNFCGLKKKLAEFHPLSDDDAWLLQMRSGREFNLNFINQLLLRLSEKYPNNRFDDKKAVLSYMTKALTYELRDACKVNNEGFKFKRDQVTFAREEYLQKAEYSHDTSTTGQFRRKIAAVFDPKLAYELLTSCSFADPQGDCYSVRLVKDIVISSHVKEALLQEAKAVYGNGLKTLEITPFKNFIGQNSKTYKDAKLNNKVDRNRGVNSYGHLQGLDSDSVWFKVRKHLIAACGIHTDKSWFSKLEVAYEDHVTKKLILKPQSSFFGSWITQNYQTALENAFIAQGFSFEIADC